MSDREYTKYQQAVIRRYYENRDAIALQRAQEQVTELYLAEGKKRQRIWQSLEKNLARLGLSQQQIEHLRTQDDPALVAKIISKLV